MGRNNVGHSVQRKKLAKEEAKRAGFPAVVAC